MSKDYWTTIIKPSKGYINVNLYELLKYKEVPIKIQNSGKRSIAIGTALIVFALITRMVDSPEYRIELMAAFIFPIVAAVPFLIWGAGRFYAYRRWKKSGFFVP